MHSFGPTIFLKNTTESLCFLQTLHLNFNLDLIDFLEQLEEILAELQLPLSRLSTKRCQLQILFQIILNPFESFRSIPLPIRTPQNPN